MWDQNHPTNNVAWDVRAARFGITVTRVSTPARPVGLDELVAVFERALTPRTRVLALTHVSNVSGVRLPVAELCKVAHRRGIHVHVDGAQTWGVLDLDLAALGCDSFTASAHKWFRGTEGSGVALREGRAYRAHLAQHRRAELGQSSRTPRRRRTQVRIDGTTRTMRRWRQLVRPSTFTVVWVPLERKLGSRRSRHGSRKGSEKPATHS